MNETKFGLPRLAAMMLDVLLALAAQTSTAPPDIQLRAQVRARSLTIEQKGTTRLQLTAEPDAGTYIDVKAPAVDRTASNITVTVDAQARIATPPDQPATPPR